jgi:hypothetical protein
MASAFRVTVSGPFGPMTVTEEGGRLTRLDWIAAPGDPSPLPESSAPASWQFPQAPAPGRSGRICCAIPAKVR